MNTTLFSHSKSRIKLLLLFALPLCASAQDIRINCATLDVESLHIKVEPVIDGLYNVYGQHNEGQMMIPLYAPSGSATVEMRLTDGCPMVENDDNNRALSAFNYLTYTRARTYWMQGAQWSAEQIEAYLKSYVQAADSLITLYNPAEPVKRYLRLWAYVHTFNEFDSMPNATKKKPADIGLTLDNVLERPEKALDDPMAAHFPLASYVVFRTLPAGTYDERVAYMQQHYANSQLRTQVEAMLEKRKTAPKGMSFPEKVKLVDVQGNVVDFAQFRGKYVYVDLWASWCGPCCKEVPFLQELEKTLDNPDVVFVSVSLDKDETAWKNKMAQLDMHGHQLHNADGSLAEALHVTGIPHFVIYDKEGRLYMSGAPRPSHPSTKLLLQELH